MDVMKIVDRIKSVFNKDGKLIRKKSRSSISFTSDELTKIFQKEQVCPDCGKWDFYEGPSGGMSTNIYCGNCGSWFNDSGPFGIERIRWLNIEANYSNYTVFTRDIINNWHDLFTKSTHIECGRWCEENISGVWSSKPAEKDRASGLMFYFEEESDAMAFKLVWK